MRLPCMAGEPGNETFVLKNTEVVFSQQSSKKWNESLGTRLVICDTP